MQKEQIRGALGKAGLAHVAVDVEKLLLPSIRLKTRPADESKLAIGAPKIGGAPDLPAQVEWPTWQGKPLSFVAQVNLSQASKYDDQKLLPQSGTLHFFYDADQQAFGADPADRGGWKVLYTAASTPLMHRSPPDNLQVRFRACDADFSTEFTLPQDVSLYDLNWSKDDLKRYSDFMAQFPTDRGTPHHRMLGHPDQIQDDMHAQAERVSRNMSTSPTNQAALNWLLLLQIDTDESIGMRWANTGMLYYWLERQALQSQNFENVWVVLQSE